MAATAEQFFERRQTLGWARILAGPAIPLFLAAESAEDGREPADDPNESSGLVSRDAAASSGGPAKAPGGAAPPPGGQGGMPESAVTSPQEFDDVTAQVVELIPQHLERVATRCYAMLGDWKLTEEATQETMVNLMRAARRAPSLKDDEAVTAWVNDLARRVCLDVLRRRAVATAADAADAGPRVERRSHERSAQGDRGARHRGSATSNRPAPDKSAQMVAKLDEPVRSILKMRLWDNLSFDEIGRALGKPAAAVVSHYQLALAKLKKLHAAPPDASADGPPSSEGPASA